MENYDEFGGFVVVSYVSATSYNCEKKHYSCLLVISRLAVNLKGAFLIKTQLGQKYGVQRSTVSASVRRRPGFTVFTIIVNFSIAE